MWFIDSLINGNVKELRAFALALTAKNIKMRWTGYARCDGRMDDAYFKDIAEGGCIMLNFGCESGSQKVLDDMAKGVTIKEMEDNNLVAQDTYRNLGFDPAPYRVMQRLGGGD